MLTPLTPSYVHMSPACEWEISMEGEGIDSEPPASECRQSTMSDALKSEDGIDSK